MISVLNRAYANWVENRIDTSRFVGFFSFIRRSIYGGTVILVIMMIWYWYHCCYINTILYESTALSIVLQILYEKSTNSVLVSNYTGKWCSTIPRSSFPMSYRVWMLYQRPRGKRLLFITFRSIISIYSKPISFSQSAITSQIFVYVIRMLYNPLHYGTGRASVWRCIRWIIYAIKWDNLFRSIWTCEMWYNPCKWYISTIQAHSAKNRRIKPYVWTS